MSWVRIDDKAWAHPKLSSLSGNAVRLWLWALCWCNQQESDGRIPSSVLRLLGGCGREAKELVESGLWEEADGGWQVHDYLQYQPSKQQLEKTRTETRERVAAARERRRNANVTPLHASTDLTCNANVTTAPTQPVPTQPNPTQPASERERAQAPETPPKRPPKGWRRIPSDWVPNETELRAICAETGASYERELANLRDYEFKTTHTDADATARTWMRRATPAVPNTVVRPVGKPANGITPLEALRRRAMGESQ